MRTLRERERELAAIDRLLRDAREGAGRALWLGGPAGIGRTALIDVAVQRGLQAGIGVLAASCAEDERDVPLGVARQLLEGPLAGAGHSAVAPRLPGAGPGAADGLDPQLRHDLAGICVELARRDPLLLCVDDLQWIDVASLRWLAYLLRRAGGLRIAVLLAGREPRARAALAQLPVRVVEELTVRPLSPGAVAEMAGAGATAGLHALTGGVPWLVHQVLRDPAALGVARDVDARLARAGEDARALATAAAVLGPDAHLGPARQLAGLAVPAAEDALDALAAEGLVAPSFPVVFTPPAYGRVILTSLPAGRRSGLHRRAAGLLDRLGAPAAACGRHLLQVAPAADPGVVATLRAAAAAAEPEAAARFLRRALEEPPQAPDRAEVLLEAGRAERLLAPEDAAEKLRRAADLAEDPLLRLRALAALRVALLYAGADAAANETGRRVAELGLAHGRVAELPPETADLILRHAPAKVREREFHELRRAAGSRRDAPALASLAIRGAATGAVTAAEAAALAEEAVAIGRGLEQREVLFAVVWAYEFADRIEPALELADRFTSSARARGSGTDVAFGECFGALLRYRCGRLRQAGELARSALERARAQDLPYVIDVATAALALAAHDAGNDEEARRVLDELGMERLALDRDMQLPLFARGRIKLAHGCFEEAAADLERAGVLMAVAGTDAAGYHQWRAEAAVAHHAAGRGARARGLAAEELARCERFGAARSLGIALRASALVAESPAERIAALERAADVLRRSACAIERARVLLDLGIALRAARRPREARAPLRDAVAVATGCGALPLAERATDELLAAGGRRPSRASEGPGALTAAELRVVRLAAQRVTNAEIARRLFLSRRTVEGHLQRAYRKLGVHSREQLPPVLDREAAP